MDGSHPTLAVSMALVWRHIEQHLGNYVKQIGPG